MSHKWVTDESNIGCIFEYISHLLLHIYQSLTLSQPCTHQKRKMNVIFDQSEECDPVVSLLPFCDTLLVGFLAASTSSKIRLIWQSTRKNFKYVFHFKVDTDV